jgi:hypothetical protein
MNLLTFIEDHDIYSSYPDKMLVLLLVTACGSS